MKPRIEAAAKDALTAAAGNMAVAEAKFIQGLLKDPKLLLEAVAPHLRPISLQILAQVARPKAARAPNTANRLSLKAIAEQPGYNPMQAEKAGPKTTASATHVATMRLLVNSYKKTTRGK